MAGIEIGGDTSADAKPGDLALQPPQGDPETRHRLRKALRILLAARRRDDRGSKQNGV